MDAVIKLYTLDHCYKYISVYQVSINQNTVVMLFKFISSLENYGR